LHHNAKEHDDFSTVPLGVTQQQSDQTLQTNYINIKKLPLESKLFMISNLTIALNKT